MQEAVYYTLAAAFEQLSRTGKVPAHRQRLRRLGGTLWALPAEGWLVGDPPRNRTTLAQHSEGRRTG
jgi:hypothetical protein